MDYKEYSIDYLKSLQINEDTERAHKEADAVLCRLLCHLGHFDVVEEYDKIRKWYA